MPKDIESVIITGSSSGIGAATAKRFVEMGAGVVLHGRDASRLEAVRESLGPTARAEIIAGDIADPETGRKLAQTAIDSFGRIDVLINNAGQFGVKPFLEVTPEDLEQFHHTNLLGTYFTTQAVVPSMIENRYGAILNTGTVLVNHSMTTVPVTAPMTSKGGVHGFSVALAAELAPHNIRVNVVAPGIIRTPLIGGSADDFAPIHPLGRIGEADEIAQAFAYLAQAEFVTGTVHEVDGGNTHAR
jgi:NAD(P)-dependent dehydrogenase (short-subunit alcohol dehydrogenase family)